MNAITLETSQAAWGPVPRARRQARTGRPARRPRRTASSWTAPILWALVLACFIVFVGTLPTVRDISARPSAAAATVRVRTADTLWSIAAAHRSPGTSTAETVDRIMAANGLTSPRLRAGMTLVVPCSDPAGTALAEATAR